MVVKIELSNREGLLESLTSVHKGQPGAKGTEGATTPDPVV